MSSYCKYYKEKEQVSYDNGVTWIDVSGATRKGELIEMDSPDCGYVPPTDYANQYLTFVAKGNGTLWKNRHSETFQYSMDEGHSWQNATSATTINVNSGDRVMFKGTLTPVVYTSGGYFDTANAGIGTFSATTNFDIEGNPMSLLFGDNFRGQTSLSGKKAAFYRLFNSTYGYNIYWVSSIENLVLPATTLSEYCYEMMFFGCRSITTVPELPATTMVNECYFGMFSSCKSLTTVPSNLLPATTLARCCYCGMFGGCPLTTAPDLPATIMASQCYSQMFKACTSLTAVPSLPATTLAESCYYNMFGGCTSITTVPSNYLPVTTLQEGCYQNMFDGCTSLTNVPNLPATTLANSCYQSMFEGCTSITTVPSNYLPVTTLQESCYYKMFAGCSGLTTAPDLPATTLVYWCYYQMFSGCTSLNYVKCLATSISATGCRENWLSGVASTGTFVKKSSMSGWPSGASGIPSNWTIQNA